MKLQVDDWWSDEELSGQWKRIHGEGGDRDPLMGVTLGCRNQNRRRRTLFRPYYDYRGLVDQLFRIQDTPFT